MVLFCFREFLPAIERRRRCSEALATALVETTGAVPEQRVLKSKEK